ncbi:MAG: lytic transglycosylase domain-containing protein [Candidatus Tectomicrobia bacterium]|uniref:Lytic transglycosylase domain-containing protein n=1 Tax=Tectimicrobiota bacterium TaxID=2528274 RepID=A0A932GMN3_UNCTE|nr:lytic transglycosylase domain-containing protein [Candidatus Tectomicrobia bacterium]
MGYILVFLSLFFASWSAWFVPAPAQAEVFKWIDEQGNLHFTDAPSDGRFHALVGPAPRNSGRTAATGKNEPALTDSSIESLISKISGQHGLDPELVRAVIRVESNYDPRAVSRRGAQGLMQLMPETVNRFRVLDPFNAEQNIRAGAQYLKYLMERFQGNLKLALAAYNAGENSVDRHGGVPPYRETTSYLEKIFRIYQAPVSFLPTRIYRIVGTDGSILFTDTPR